MLEGEDLRGETALVSSGKVDRDVEGCGKVERAINPWGTSGLIRLPQF